MATNPFVILTDRTRTITYQECPRRRFYGYHYGPADLGITYKSNYIPLVTGTLTHHGLALMLGGMDLKSVIEDTKSEYWKAIAKRGLILEPGEDAAFVADEQCALIEGMLRAYHYWQLPKLQENYEILEVEKDGLWPMHITENYTVGWQFRPDALLLERSSNDLYILSFKTAAMFGSRNEHEAEHDMQGLSELAATEARLALMWEIFQDAKRCGSSVNYAVAPALAEFLRESPAPPKIQGVKMEYLLKGQRKEDGEDSGIYVQWSPLIRGWWKPGIVSGSDEFAWNFTTYGPDTNARTGKLVQHRLGKGWERFNAWEHPGGVEAWVGLLINGLQSDAGNVFEKVIATPIPYYRQEVDVQDWKEQTIGQETRIFDGLGLIKTLIQEHGYNSAEVRQALNYCFPQHRRSCDWPSKCQFQDICFNSQIGENPMESGLFIIREPHHAEEMKKYEQFVKENSK